MARRNGERRTTGRRHTMATLRHAGELALYRADLDGMDSWHPDFEATLNNAVEAATNMLGRASRMDPDGLSRRAALANIAMQVTQQEAA